MAQLDNDFLQIDSWLKAVMRALIKLPRFIPLRNYR